jgi:hypothetical protein
MEACAFCDDGVSMCVGVYIDTKYATFVMEAGNGSSLCVPVKTRSSFGGRHDCSAAAVLLELATSRRLFAGQATLALLADRTMGTWSGPWIGILFEWNEQVAVL